jgi:hypothetical protein
MSGRQRRDGSELAWQRSNRPAPAPAGTPASRVAAERSHPQVAGATASARHRERTGARAARAGERRRRESRERQRKAAEQEAASSAEHTEQVRGLIAEAQEKIYQKRGRIASAFELLDRDRDGRVSRQEVGRGLGDLLNRELTAAQLDAVMGVVDVNSDGVVDLNEFVRCLKIHDMQTRDVIPSRVGQAAQRRRRRRKQSGSPDSDSAQSQPQPQRGPPSATVEGARVTPSGADWPPQCEPDWLPHRQQQLSEMGRAAKQRASTLGSEAVAALLNPTGPAETRLAFAAHLRRNQPEAGRRPSTTPPGMMGAGSGRSKEPMWEVQCKATQRRRAAARVAQCRANRERFDEKSRREQARTEATDAARLAAISQLRREWTYQIRVREFYACGFHGSHLSQQPPQPAAVGAKERHDGGRPDGDGMGPEGGGQGGSLRVTVRQEPPPHTPAYGKSNGHLMEVLCSPFESDCRRC